MAATAKMFDSYSIFYYTHRPFAPFQAMIYCYRGSECVGRIVFYPDGDVPPSGEASLHYPFSRFTDIFSILRAETPLYLWWDSYREGDKTVVFGMLSSGEEAPAEEGTTPAPKS